MATVPLVQYENAPASVKEIFDDIKRTRDVEDVNNFWKALANQPDTLAQYQELLAVVATAHLTNALANGFKVPVDERFKRD